MRSPEMTRQLDEALARIEYVKSGRMFRDKLAARQEELAQPKPVDHCDEKLRKIDLEYREHLKNGGRP